MEGIVKTGQSTSESRRIKCLQWLSELTLTSFPQKGRCLAASRPLAPLDIILTDSAALVAPHHSPGPCCLECLALVEGEGAPCPHCGALLCSSDCWGGPTHEGECGLLAR